MDKFISHSGFGVPLRRSNVDTDQIIPAEYLKRITRHGFEDALFKAWREDPNFVLNKPEYKDGSILIAGPEFGTGSSREHAVWALMDYGFKVVLSSRFADIFRGNSGKAGLVTALVSQDVIEKLWTLVESDPKTSITVDLEKRKVIAKDLEVSPNIFKLEIFKKAGLAVDNFKLFGTYQIPSDARNTASFVINTSKSESNNTRNKN